MAWTQEVNLNAITEVMPRSRFEKIKQRLYFSDNTKQPGKADSNYDNL